MLADFQTSNPIFGRTNNPWNVDCPPGGSSGGVAAAVASGMTPFEIGTDLSGSVRIMSCIGPIARTPEDLALLHRIIAGPDGRDSEVQPVPVEDVPELALKGLRIAFAPTFPGFPVAAHIRDAVQELALQLGRSGAVVEEAALPDLDGESRLLAIAQALPEVPGGFRRPPGY